MHLRNCPSSKESLGKKCYLAGSTPQKCGGSPQVELLLLRIEGHCRHVITISEKETQGTFFKLSQLAGELEQYGWIISSVLVGHTWESCWKV